MDEHDTDDELDDQETERLSPGELAHIELCNRIRAEAAECEDTVTIPLLRTVVIAGARCDELTMRRMRAKDMIAAQKRRKVSRPGAKNGRQDATPNAVENGLWLLARLADLAPDDLDELDMTDLDLMRAALAGFQGGRPTST